MKEMKFSLYVTNVMEELNGIDLLSGLDVHITARRLVAGENVVQPVFSQMIAENTLYVKLASINDSFVIDDPENDILIEAPEATIFIGAAEKCRILATAMGYGRFGYVAEYFWKPGDFSRAYWVTEIGHSGDGAREFLSGKPIKPDAAAAAAEKEEPAAEPNPKAEKPKKPKAKKAAEKPDVEPEAEPAAAPEDTSAEPPKETAKPKGRVIAHRDDPDDKSGPTLEELFAMTSPKNQTEDDEATEAAESAEDEEADDDVEETAEETCRRMCRQEGIAYDIEKHGQPAEDCDCDSDEDADA